MNLSAARKLFVVSKIGIRKPDTVEWWRTYTNSLVDLLGEEPIDQIDVTDLRFWRAELTSRKQRYVDHPYRASVDGGLAVATLDNHVRAAKGLFNWLYAEGHLRENPAERLERPTLGEPPPKAIAVGEVEMMMRAAKETRHSERDYAIIRTLAATGIRRRGLLTLTRSDVCLERRMLMVCEKRDKTRWVRFDERTADAIRQYLRVRPNVETPILYVSQRRRPLTGSGLYQMLKRVAKKAGVDRYNPHAFRHFAAMQLIRHGADPKVVKRTLGHTSMKTTMRYIEWTRQEYLERYDNFAPLKDL